MAEETSDEEYLPYGKGIPARQLCTDEILVSLMNGEMTFTNFIDQFKGRASRGTVNRYLDELCDDSKGKVKLITHKSKGRNLGPYILTEAGKKDAEERLPSYVLRSVTNQELKGFITAYKLVITPKIRSCLVFEVTEQRDVYDRKIRARVFGRHRGLTSKEATEQFITSIEKDLLLLGFSKVEIIRLWLLANGDIIKDILANLGAPNFYSHFGVEIPPRYNLEDRTYLIKQIKKAITTTIS